MTNRNVVIFGESGSGKSSLVNLLLGQYKADVSDKAVGCTFNFHRYETPKFNVYDTIGLSEGVNGTVRADVAVKDLMYLLKSLHDGVSLLVFVVPKGRIKKTLKKNYNLFVECLCRKQVPVVLVITHCEMDTEPGAWWKENQVHFEKYGMHFKAVVSGTALQPKCAPEIMRSTITELNNQTTMELLKAIDSSMLAIPWTHTGGWLNWFYSIAKKVALVIGRGLKAHIESTAETSEKLLMDFFKSEGYTADESDEMVQHFNLNAVPAGRSGKTSKNLNLKSMTK